MGDLYVCFCEVDSLIDAAAAAIPSRGTVSLYAHMNQSTRMPSHSPIYPHSHTVTHPHAPLYTHTHAHTQTVRVG